MTHHRTIRRGAWLAAGTAALLYATAAAARPPVADEIGEFYAYFDEAGQQVGSSSMDCEGNYAQGGVLTARYSNGYAFCPPDR